MSAATESDASELRRSGAAGRVGVDILLGLLWESSSSTRPSSTAVSLLEREDSKEGRFVGDEDGEGVRVRAAGGGYGEGLRGKCACCVMVAVKCGKCEW